jgi:signal transduction histidine kinase
MTGMMVPKAQMTMTASETDRDDRGVMMPRRRTTFLASTRARILVSFVLLLVASTLISTVLLRQLLLDRVDDRVQAALAQEVEEFRRLARGGIDPETRRPFASIRRLFDVYLSRNVPNVEEDWYMFVEAQLYRDTVASGRAAPVGDVSGLRRVSRTARGELAGPDGQVSYLAVPVRLPGKPQGVFVVTSGLEGERAEVDDATQVAAGISLAVLAGASLLAFVLAGRTLAPLRQVTDTARAITETDLTRRIEVTGSDEISVLGRTFNDMLDRLDAAFESQRAFVSDAGHELRTPITIIRGHLELLDRQLPERHETIELVIDELARMSRIVDDLLTLAKAERNDFLELEDLDLDVLTEELLSKAEALAPRRWELEQLGVGRITADRQRLTQAVMNLAGNAVKATQEGDLIRIGSALANGHARLWVRDTGTGIPLRDQQRIFERFHRGTVERRRSEGAGLGLAIVRAIAEAHGGAVRVHSREGEGSTFTMQVPAEPADNPARESL